MKATVIEFKDLFDDLHDIIKEMKNYDESTELLMEALDDFMNLSEDEITMTSEFIGFAPTEIKKNAENSAELVARVVKTVDKHEKKFGRQTVLDAIAKIMTTDFNAGLRHRDYNIDVKLEVR